MYEVYLELVFADVEDTKSPFTADHSRRVTHYADMIAEEFGFDPQHRRWLRRAGLLHDIGKLAVSNQISTSPASRMRRSRRRSAGIPAAAKNSCSRPVFAASRRWPAAHERLDGRGYPRGSKGEVLCLETRS